MVKHTITLDYDEVTDVTPDVRITLYNAGHILGSSMVHMHIGNGLHNILYTGDMKYGRTMLLEPAVTQFPRLETLMIESTYGSKDDVLPPRDKPEDDCRHIIQETIKRGGKVLIPVLGHEQGFILSGVILSALILAVAYISLPWFGPAPMARYIALGLGWLFLTLVFEFTFGRLIQGKPWPELLEAYTFKGGNIWPVVLLVVTTAPYIAARIRGWG